jgi:hypothetical protein
MDQGGGQDGHQTQEHQGMGFIFIIIIIKYTLVVNNSKTAFVPGLGWSATLFLFLNLEIPAIDLVLNLEPGF